ncbi:hypothetical protein PUN28_017279 [Cardiocondyla obscurior]|uniref:Uncharacterized protein n=1 Tax=Cardiocondyla obscurior TaxID=286306 RepID=A0AAW2EMQ2_9HYME
MRTISAAGQYRVGTLIAPNGRKKSTALYHANPINIFPRIFENNPLSSTKVSSERRSRPGKGHRASAEQLLDTGQSSTPLKLMQIGKSHDFFIS